jgi:uncharacterized protein YjiK
MKATPVILLLLAAGVAAAAVNDIFGWSQQQSGGGTKSIPLTGVAAGEVIVMDSSGVPQARPLLTSDITGLDNSISGLRLPPLSGYTLRQTIGTMSGLAGSGVSGASYNGRNGNVFIVRNVSLANGEEYEMTPDGRLIRTITNSGFEDTEAVEWVGYDTVNACDVVLVCEEDHTTAANDSRISLCRLTAGATSLTRTGTGNVSTATAYSGNNMGNLGLESICYDPLRGVIYYTAEKQTSAVSDNTQGTGAAKIFTRSITWAGGTYSFGAESVLCSINGLFSGTLTDVSDMAFDAVTDTILLLSDESDKVVRISRAGTVLEQLATPGTQPEGLAVSPDGKNLWVTGEPQEFYRYSAGAGQVGTGGNTFTANQYFPDGTASFPSIAFASQTAVGFRVSGTGNGLYVSTGGTDKLYLNSAGVGLQSNGLIAWSSTGAPNGTADAVLQRKAARTVQAGAAASGSPLTYTVQIGEDSRGGTDTNIAGASGTIRPGTGTGTGAVSSLLIDTPTIGTTGTTAQTYATRITVNSGAVTVTPPLVATNIVLTPNTTTYAATTNLDFALNSLTTVTLAGNVTFTTSNLAAGRSVTVRVISDASLRTFAFPGWVFIGAAAPASIAASKTGVLTLTSFGTTDADVVAAWAVQP